MIQIDWTCTTSAGPEAACALVASLRAAGLPAGLVATSLSAEPAANQAVDFARLVAPAPVGRQDRLLVLSGHTATDAHFSALRRLSGSNAPLGVVVTGHFDSRQAEIAVRSRFGYALGQDPALLPLPQDEASLLGSPIAPVFGLDRAVKPVTDGPLRVLLVAPDIEDGAATKALQALAVSRKLAVTILTDGKSKTLLRSAGCGLPVYHYSEVALWSLACRADVAVFCQPIPRSYPVRMMLADLAVSGAALLDASPGFANRRREPAFVPAPADPVALAAFLTTEVRPDLHALADLSRGSAIAQAATAALVDLQRLLAPDRHLAALPRATVQVHPRIPDPVRSRIVFLPTNGVGLGHAQRCSIIAGAMPQAAPATPVFAAFPSCMRLIKSHGFDVMPLVPKSTLHAEAFANDMVNAVRLDGLLATAAAFVFDGGYVFNSVFRTVLERGVPSAWIRRGLWQAGQDNSVALEREKVFDRVIVPLEAFEELNEDYSVGPRVTKVGPIVRQVSLSPPERQQLRQALADRFGLPCQQLVVTMLGGGVAADRSAQTTAVAASLARRREVLHLVVVWPTATVDPGLFAWPNTRVVRTHHAGILAAAADLFISAVGYNSFHEAMYNRIPTIFVPQMAAFMDDQRSRAVAAVERGVARLVEPHELMSLDRTISRILDGGEGEDLRARLAALALPVPGAEAAAACITDMAGLAPLTEPRPKNLRMA